MSTSMAGLCAAGQETGQAAVALLGVMDGDTNGNQNLVARCQGDINRKQSRRTLPAACYPRARTGRCGWARPRGCGLPIAVDQGLGKQVHRGSKYPVGEAGMRGFRVYRTRAAGRAPTALREVTRARGAW